MPEVPVSAIPAAAWGISGHALTADEIAAGDPFGGNGERLDIPPDMDLSIEDIQNATGMSHVVLFSSARVAWIEREPGVGGIKFRWLAWVARHGGVSLPGKE
jgi:hypothetical protein